MNALHWLKKTSVGEGIATRPTSLTCVCLLLALAVGGCVEPYPVQPVYGSAYAPPPPVYRSRAYVAPAAVSIEIGDRPYYTRGSGYYVGRAYYVWRPGHWSVRHGRRVWIHGHYVLRR